MYYYKKYVENDGESNEPRASDNFIKWTDMNYPVCNDDITHFEEINGNTISVNVYTMDEEKKSIKPDRITTIFKASLSCKFIKDRPRRCF